MRIDYRPYEPDDIGGIVDLCQAEAWMTFASDPDRTHHALTNPGVTTLVATDDDAVVGFICLLSDGEIQAYISALAVRASHRRQGIGTALVTGALRLAGGERLDVLCESEHFYTSIPNRRMGGFRLHPSETIVETRLATAAPPIVVDSEAAAPGACALVVRR